MHKLEKKRNRLRWLPSIYIASATMKNLQLLSQVVYSNSMAVVEQHHFFFENLWDKSISATEKIDEIEKGIVPEIVDVIKNPFEIKSIFFDVLKSITTEIMFILKLLLFL